jgi:hypothetical protein
MQEKFKIQLAISFIGLMLLVVSPAYARHVDDGFGEVISASPQKYVFDAGEIVTIKGEVHALRNGYPVLVRVFNSDNGACNFQHLSLDNDMKFKSKPIKLDGYLCGINGKYKVTVHYGSAKAITEFYVGGSDIELTSGKAEVINAQIVSDFVKIDNKYPVDLYWSASSVLIRNNMNKTITSYIVFAEYDANETTKELSFTQVTLKPYKIEYTSVPFVPRIVDGKPNGYLHVFAWTSLDSPTPLHPGLYVPS